MEFNYTREKKKEGDNKTRVFMVERKCLGHQTSIRMVLLEKEHCREWIRTVQLARIDLAEKSRAKGFGRRRAKYRNHFSRNYKH